MSKTNIASSYEALQIQKLSEGKIIPSFRAGDTVVVKIRIIDGTSERIGSFQGICIARSNKGINSTCIVRKISSDIGVERIISIYSPLVVSIEVVRKGDVRRAKLFYLRNLRGKKARIKEKNTYVKKENVA